MSNLYWVSGESIQFVFNIHDRKGGKGGLIVPPGTNSWRQKKMFNLKQINTVLDLSPGAHRVYFWISVYPQHIKRDCQ